MRKITVLLLILLVPALILKAVDNYYSDRTTVFINSQIQTHASFVVASIISEKIVPELETENILTAKYDNSGVKSVVINTKATNAIFGMINERMGELLETEALNQAFGQVELPLGFLISQNILAGAGPKIRVPVKPLGTYRADIVTLTSEFGINNSLIEVYLVLDFGLEAFLPLAKRNVDATSKILLASLAVQGEVPRYYGFFQPALPIGEG